MMLVQSVSASAICCRSRVWISPQACFPSPPHPFFSLSSCSISAFQLLPSFLSLDTEQQYKLWHCHIFIPKQIFHCPFLASHLSLNCKGRWGTTDDFTTRFLHFSLFSTALWEFANSRPVHSLMLFSHLFLCAFGLTKIQGSNLDYMMLKCLFWEVGYMRASSVHMMLRAVLYFLFDTGRHFIYSSTQAKSGIFY